MSTVFGRPPRETKDSNIADQFPIFSLPRSKSREHAARPYDLRRLPRKVIKVNPAAARAGKAFFIFGRELCDRIFIHFDGGRKTFRHARSPPPPRGFNVARASCRSKTYDPLGDKSEREIRGVFDEANACAE